MTNHYVYRYLDAEGNTLYVGCTTDLSQRERQHKATKPWFPLVASAMVDMFLSKDDARAFERQKIEQLQPPHNTLHKAPPTQFTAIEQAKIKFTAEPGVRDLLERYIAAQNARHAGAKFTITGVVNEAIREYIERQEQEAA